MLEEGYVNNFTDKKYFQLNSTINLVTIFKCDCKRLRLEAYNVLYFLRNEALFSSVNKIMNYEVIYLLIKLIQKKIYEL